MVTIEKLDGGVGGGPDVVAGDRGLVDQSIDPSLFTGRLKRDGTFAEVQASNATGEIDVRV